MYNRRSRFNPLWNSVVIGGIENDGSSYLGTVNMIGMLQLWFKIVRKPIAEFSLLIKSALAFEYGLKIETKKKTFLTGIAFNDAAIATGFGAHLALPIMRDALEKKPNLNAAEAKELIAKCMEVLFYRYRHGFLHKVY